MSALQRWNSSFDEVLLCVLRSEMTSLQHSPISPQLTLGTSAPSSLQRASSGAHKEGATNTSDGGNQLSPAWLALHSLHRPEALSPDQSGERGQLLRHRNRLASV